MKEVGIFLNKFLQGKNKKEKYYNAFLQIKWQEVVGDYIYQKSSPSMIKDDILFLNVASSGWAHNFLIMKEEIISKINKQFYGIIIRDIKFMVRARVEHYEKIEPDASEELIYPELEEAEQEKIERNIGKIDNLFLRPKLSSLWQQDKKRKKYYLLQNFPTCKICGIQLTHQEDKCFACERNSQEHILLKLKQMFLEIPWLTLKEAQKFLQVDKQAFEQVQGKCLQEFLEKAISAEATKNDIRRYVMLKTGCNIAKLTQDLIMETMKGAGRKKHVFTPWS